MKLDAFVTGATGLVGSHVAAELRAGGHDVVALVRASSDTTFLESIGVTLVRGDVTDEPERHAERIRGADAVVHSAAALYGGDPRTFEAVNVGGTERVLRGAAIAGVTRAVHVSSIAVYGGADRSRPLTEDRWLEVEIGPGKRYPYTKRRSEEAAWSLHERGLVRLTTVRPGIIYGERDRLATPWLVKMARAPVLPLPHAGRLTLPVVYAGNVARAIVAALGAPDSAGRAYNLSDGEPITTKRLVERLAAALGRRARVVPVPVLPLVAAARVGDALLGLLPGREIVSLRRGVDRFLTDNPYDSSRARRELGWTELVSHEEAIERTARWYLSHTRERTKR